MPSVMSRDRGGEEPLWVPIEDVVEFHDLAIDRHGGRHGLRSQGLLEQTLSRPRRLWFYRGWANIAQVAACYTASVIFIHPFFDGNKRTGWGTALRLARSNGFELRCGREDAYEMVLGFAASEKGEAEESILAEFIYDHLFPL